MDKSKDSTESKDPIIKYVVGEFEKYEAYHEPRFEKAKKIIAHWRCEAPVREYSWQNAVHVPAMLEAEQTITPRISTALFPTDAPLDIKTEGDTPEQDGIIIKSLIQHYFRMIDVRSKSSSLLSQNTLLGTSYAECGTWLLKRGYTIDTATGERKIAITANRPDFNHVDFFEMFPHPAKLSMDDGLPIIRRRFVDAEYMKALAENPFFKFENLKEALDSDAQEKPEDADESDSRKQYELLDYWGPWDHTYKKADSGGQLQSFTQKAVPYWIIIINRKVKVRCIPNPYNHQMPPFAKTILLPDVRPSWFGVGVGQIGLPSQERLNKIVNQRLDNVELVLNKMGVYNGNDPLLNAKKLLVSEPGKWIKCSDPMTSIKWMDTPDVTASSYKEEEMAKNDFRESVGANSALMPAEDPNDAHRTAMGIQLLQGAAGMRFKPVLIKLEQDLIAQTADFFFMNCKQFMVESQWVEVMGEGASKMVEVTPDQILRKVRFIPTGISETVNKETQIGQLLRFKEVTVNDPTINRAELNKRIAELFGFKDINKIVIEQQQGGAQAPGSSGLSPEQEAMVKQRLSEGATPEQIKMEMLGPSPESRELMNAQG